MITQVVRDSIYIVSLFLFLRIIKEVAFFEFARGICNTDILPIYTYHRQV